jgi:hypothetical protein
MSFDLSNYETVEERLTKFWKEHPDGRIETELIEATATRFIVLARIFRTEADQRHWVSGLAFEHITERGVNATSALENCETSAIGRALANAGYATRGKRASREEMSKVVNAQPNKFEQRIADKIPVEKPSDPWTIEQKEMPLPVAEAVSALNDNIVPEEIPMCPIHNKAGLAKTGNSHGKQWKRYDCPESWPNGCKWVQWMQIDKSGRWVPQKPRPQQEVIN